MKQDLAFVVDEEVPAGELIAAAREAAGPSCASARLRRLSRRAGPRGPEVGRARVAFQSPERTLADDDAAAIRERIVAALAERFGAELRA